ncbi:hypothetical protein [Pseudoclavibacter sp. 13-3]|uniref:hypothetical protein n=1 Tax=Pseudoclavibacter sp. 13-3 TaxID=2901228 RepID=UPI001E35336C|nr:hypothetical protein [Pseudoclavibacter sp. 13-3]MCD7100513.1 hypothetical protein [Pseudoclavibacter sp. 13-3]
MTNRPVPGTDARLIAVLCVLLCIVLALSGCSNAVADGSASRAVQVSSGFGLEPDVHFDAPLAVDRLQRTVVTSGDGPKITDDTTVAVKAKVISADDDAAISAPGSWPRAFTMTVRDAEPGVAKAVAGLQGGSRVVVTGSAQSFYGDERLGATGLAPDHGVVTVLDVAVPPTDDRPTQQSLADDDFPQATFQAGRPVEVTPGSGRPPQTTQVKVLTPGTGPRVGEGGDLVFRAYTTTWGLGDVVGDDFSTGASSRALSALPEGLRSAMSGQAVGTTLMAVVPPAEGIRDQLPEALKHETLVFVVTIDGTSLATG